MSDLEKDWLIRTKKKQILGPVSRSKVVEFVEKGSLGADDELTTGNGYWFHIRETELLEKYLFSNQQQSFDPIGEAPDVLVVAHKGNSETVGIEELEQGLIESGTIVKVPAKEDLEYPELEDLGLEADEGGDDPTHLPSHSDLEFPDVDGFASYTAARPAVRDKEIYDTDDKRGSVVKEVARVEAPIEPLAVKEVLEDGEEVLLPSDDDLAFPDMDMENVEQVPGMDEATLMMTEQEIESEQEFGAVVQELDGEYVHERETEEIDLLKKLGRGLEETKIPPRHLSDVNPLRNTKSGGKVGGAAVSEDKTNSTRKPISKMKEVKIKRVYETPDRNDRYLIVIFFILLFGVFGIVFYYVKILNKPIPFFSSLSPISTLYAQDEVSLSKKKAFLNSPM